MSYLLQRRPDRKGLDGLVVRLRLRHALVDPLVRDGVVLLLLGALALDALPNDSSVQRERRKNQRVDSPALSEKSSTPRSLSASLRSLSTIVNRIGILTLSCRSLAYRAAVITGKRWA